MIDYRAKTNFNTTFFIVNEDTLEIEERTLLSLCDEYADDCDVHAEGTSLYYTSFGKQKLIEEFDTEEEALHAMNLARCYDMENAADCYSLHPTREAAQEAIDEGLYE